MWQYKVTGLQTEKQLNKLGEEGWELVATTSGPVLNMYFKREQPQGGYEYA